MRHLSQRLLVALLFAAAFLIVAPQQAAAGGCNLDGGAGIDCTINSGLFDVSYTHPTGTGVIDSFLRVQMNGTEEAFNTDARPITCNGSQCEDYKTDPNYTRNLLTSTVPITTIDGQDYLTFYLDINEQASGYKKYLTLDQLRIYGSDTPDLSSYTTAGGVSGADLLFDLDNGVADKNWINLDYTLVGGGSGSGDMVAYIPVGNALNYDYIYLYSQFGCTTGCSNDSGAMNAGKKYKSGAGFEEWWVPYTSDGGGGGGGTTAVPEPATLTLLATGLALAARNRRRGNGPRGSR